MKREAGRKGHQEEEIMKREDQRGNEEKGH